MPLPCRQVSKLFTGNINAIKYYNKNNRGLQIEVRQPAGSRYYLLFFRITAISNLLISYFFFVQKKIIQAGADPANPEQVKTQVKSFFKQLMGKGMLKIAVGSCQAAQCYNQQYNAGDIGNRPAVFFVYDILQQQQYHLNSK